MEGKKADVVSLQTVLIILAIFGLAIVLVLLYRFIATENVDREVCHESVVLKATLPDLPILQTKEVTPLKCKTRKVCIVKGGLINSVLRIFKGSGCEEFKGEKHDKVVVSGTKSEIERQINMFLAREMADCWAMMGEGKVQIFARELAKADRKCVLCSRIAFSKELQEEMDKYNGRPAIKGTVTYLLTHNVPNKDITYWEFLTRSQTSSKYILEQMPLFQSEDITYLDVEKSIVFEEFQKARFEWIGTVVGASVGAVSGASIGAVIGSVVPIAGTAIGAGLGFALGIAGGFVGGYEGYNSGALIRDVVYKFEGNTLAGQFYLDNPKVSSLNCGSFENIP